MFKTSDNYFKEVRCPEESSGSECKILNCIFQHKTAGIKRPVSPIAPTNDAKRVNTEPKKVYEVEKYVKPAIEDDEEDEDEEGYRLVPKPITHITLNFEIRHANIQKIIEYYEDEELEKTEQDAIEQEYKLAELSGSPEEYTNNVDLFLQGKEIVEAKDPVYILPKEVKPKPPAGLPERKKFIQIMIDTLKKKEPNVRTPILKCIEEEHKIATSTTAATYNQSIKKKIHQIANPEKYQRKVRTLSNAEMLAKLEELVIPIPKLEKFGYVMTPPEPVTLDKKRFCRRCGAEFTFDNQLDIVSCKFHAGKIRRKDKLTRIYDCCGTEVGNENVTCSTFPHHIFYWNNVQEMHTAIPFQMIAHVSSSASKALGIDCEMGYTTLGFELLRITAIDFITGEDVFDIFVRPKGKVVDLNTRYSGVSEIIDGALSFDESMHYLRQYIDKTTILIGHGLENDMNAMRLIHKRIVDTAILYPKFKASPTFRFSLKDLAFSYLSRNIQSGEHDSREDSIAAIDIVKYFINLETQSQR